MIRCLYQHPPPARNVRSEGCPPADGRAPRPPWKEGEASKNLGKPCKHSLPLLIIRRYSLLRAVVDLVDPPPIAPAIPKQQQQFPRISQHRSAIKQFTEHQEVLIPAVNCVDCSKSYTYISEDSTDPNCISEIRSFQIYPSSNREGSAKNSHLF